MRPHVAAVSLLLAAALSAQGGWKDLRGKQVPEIRVQKWLNTDGQEPTSATLKGKVWLLQFFATT